MIKGKPQLLDFVPTNSPILREKCYELSTSEIQSDKIQTLIQNLVYTIENSNRGVGLSTNQIGKSEAICVVDIKPTPARPDLQPFRKVYINPKITQTFGDKEPMWEGCLSTAIDKNGESSMAQVPRFNKIEVEYLDRESQQHRKIIEGFLAQVLQHEIDHLNGILFTDLINNDKLISYQEYINITKEN